MGLVRAECWHLSWRADPAVVPLADRHYSRQTLGSRQFVPPGRCLVLKALAPGGAVGAYWVTSWPLPEFVKHAWAGAWMCSAFRNERPDLWLSSSLVAEAVAITRGEFGPAPAQGFVTFVDAGRTRAKRDPGRCFRRAGWAPVGTTKDLGLVALQLPVEALGGVEPLAPATAQLSLFEVAAS